jgi:hypothetical protein
MMNMVYGIDVLVDTRSSAKAAKIKNEPQPAKTPGMSGYLGIECGGKSSKGQVKASQGDAVHKAGSWLRW